MSTRTRRPRRRDTCDPKRSTRSYWRVRCAARVPEGHATHAAGVAQRLHTVSRCARIFSIPTAISDASWERRRSAIRAHASARAATLQCHPLLDTIALPPKRRARGLPDMVARQHQESARTQTFPSTRSSPRSRACTTTCEPTPVVDCGAANAGAPRHVDRSVMSSRRGRARTRSRSCVCCTPRLPSAGSRARAPTNSFVASNRSTVATTPDPRLDRRQRRRRMVDRISWRARQGCAVRGVGRRRHRE